MEHATTISMPSTTTRRDPLGRVLFIIALAALALAPTQLTLPGLPLSPAELLLALAALVWAVRWWWVRDTHSLPPLANWLVVLAGVLSVVSLLCDTSFAADAGQAKDMIKAFATELAQMILYLLVGVTIFRAVLTDPRRIRTAVIALLATTSLAVALGIAQRGMLQREYQPDALQRAVYHHFTPQAYLHTETPMEVCSTFGSWNEKGFHASRTAYAGFLGLVLPFALALLVTTRRRAITVWMALLFLGAAVSVLAGYLVPAMLLGLLVTGAAMGARVGRGVLIGILGYLLLLAVIGGYNRTEVLQEPFRFQISANEANNPNFRYDGERHLKKFWGEQLAALNIIRGTSYVKNAGLFGVGIGQYQKNIQEGYNNLSAVSNQRLESDSQSGFLLTMVNTGILGLAAWLALYGMALSLAWQQARAQRGNPWAAAALGAMVTLLLITVTSNPWVRGTSVVIAALLAMLLNRATLAPLARTDQ